MNKFWTLTKVLLKTSGENFPRLKGKKTGKVKNVFLIALIGLAFLPLVIITAGLIANLYDALLPIGQEGLALALGIGLVAISIFFLGIFYVAGVFYFARDIESLLPLPLSASEILGAKLIVTLAYEYLTELVVLLPILIVYGFKSKGGVLYYLYGGIIFLVLPVIALVPAALLNMIILGFTNLAKNKDRFRVVGGVIAIFLGLGLNIILQKFAGFTGNPQKLQQMFLEGNNSFVGLVARLFPGARFAALALIKSRTVAGLLNLFLFVLVCVGFLLLYFIIGQLLYSRGVVGSSEAPSGRKGLTFTQLGNNVRQNSALKSATLKELKILFRTPIFFLNCVLMNFLWPAFLLIPLLTQPEMFKYFHLLECLIKDERMGGIVLSVTFAFSLFLSATNGITASSISREGQNLFINKCLPLNYKTQLLSKVLSGIILSSTGILILAVTVFIFTRLPLQLLFLLLVVGFLAIIFPCLLGILIDLNFPKLDWDNEQKAVKQNFNVILNLLLSLALAGVWILLAVKFRIGFTAMLLLIILISALLNLILYKILVTKGVELFARLET